MNQIITVTTVLVGIGWALTSLAEEKPRWADPQVFEVNAEPPHAFTHVFPSSAAARPEPDWANPFAGSERYLVLNGKWKFQWSENPASAPKDFHERLHDVSAWDDIAVPLPWQMAGHGQLYYFNARLPMLNDARNFKDGTEVASNGEDRMDLLDPQTSNLQSALKAWVPTVWNPVGTYVTEFELPDNWDGKRIVLHFSGVKGGSTSWLNGREVGYNQNGFGPVEYDVTDYVRAGTNRLAVQVVRWSDAVYLENQDRIRMSGIIRDVYLFATPKAHIGDFFIQPELNESLDEALLSVDVQLRNTSGRTAGGHSVEIELIDPQGKTVLAETAQFSAVLPGKTLSVQIQSIVARPELWHSESPQLYTALLKLKHDGAEQEVIRQDVGFRRFHWDERGNTYLNGKRYYFRGVNRSDADPDLGYSVDYADMLKDAQLMRRLNINNVRTSHNPNDIRWYALCNRFGITLLNEANVEAHNHERIFSDPTVEAMWREQAVALMVNMVARDKNQPSVIMWSLGNEQFTRGEPDPPAVRAMYDAAKAIDPTRPIFCERMFSTRDQSLYGDFLEFVGPMYAGKELYRRWQEAGKENRPFFYSEYAHAMGNSMADLADDWAYMTSHDGMNGGQIWDWRDQSVRTSLPGLDGKHFTYGGDWGDGRSDRMFCMNGIVLPDHGFTGKTYEVKGVYQQVHFDVSETPGKFEATNAFALLNLRDLDVSWTLLKHGVAIESGTLSLDVEPKSSGVFALPVDPASLDPAFDYHLNFDVALKQATRWAEVGYVVAEDQILLQTARVPPPARAFSGRVSVRETEPGRLDVSAGEAVITFDLGQGLLTQYRYRGQDLLAPDAMLPGLEANFNFALTDDTLLWPNHIVRTATQQGLYAFERQFVAARVVERSAERVRIETVNNYLSRNKQGYRHTASYTVLPGGIVQVDNWVQQVGLHSGDFTFRIGVRLPVAKAFSVASYRAFGGHENYHDRRAAARHGVYTQEAGDFFQHYVRPQENGGRSGLEWIALQNPDGLGLQLVGEEGDRSNGSVMPWTFEQFEQVTHIPYFPTSTRWILRYDAAHCGISRVRPQSVPLAGDTTFSYSLRPLDGKEHPAAKAYPAIPERERQAYRLTGQPLFLLPAGWQAIELKASQVTYSSTSQQWSPRENTLVTTMAEGLSWHSDEERNPWLKIDLEKEQPVLGVEILNRQPEHHGRGTNLHVWLSVDGKNWNPVFKSGPAQNRWLVELDGAQRARYIKIGLLNEQPQFFNLKGVKVYGPED